MSLVLVFSLMTWTQKHVYQLMFADVKNREAAPVWVRTRITYTKCCMSLRTEVIETGLNFNTTNYSVIHLRATMKYRQLEAI